jgi:cytochrome c oxidase assembly protein subunit 15
MILKRHHSLFRVFNLITIGAVYLVILAGGIVRCTGSGMGCPDWPKCFGYWVPPTQESQLPANYKEKYKVQGHEAEFNATKTWTEYSNRLVGALSGVFMLMMFVCSFWMYKDDKKVFLFTLFTLLLLMFQGWLGAKVVDSYLAPVMITIHMAIALVIVGLLWYVYYRSSKIVLLEKINVSSFSSLKLLMWLIVIATFFQILIGTEVREQIDVIALKYNFIGRSKWIDEIILFTPFKIHRILAYITTALVVFLGYKTYKNKALSTYFKNIVYTLFILIIFEMIIGYVLVFLQLPSFAQPLHLWIGSMIIGVEFMLLMIAMNSTNKQ